MENSKNDPAKNLPKLPKEEIKSPEFDEIEERKPETSRMLWIIIFAFAILATVGALVWFIFSGRADQGISGDNLAALTGEKTDSSKEKTSRESGVIVTDKNLDLTDYDSDIILSESGEYTLKGILNYAVRIKPGVEASLNLSGVTISSKETPAIFSESEAPLSLLLTEEKINSLTSVSSKGDLIIKNSGPSNGRLISSGIKSDKKVIINGGLVYLNGDEIENSLASSSGIEINGGTVIALAKESLVSPLSSSVQKTLTVNLTKEIKEGSDFSIRAVSTGSIRRLDRVETSFNSIIYSAKDLESGDYEILAEGEVVGTGTVE